MDLFQGANIQVQLFTDKLIFPLSRLVPRFVSPLHLTVLAFVCGVTTCWHVSHGNSLRALLFWGLNRLLDGLDGTVARQRREASELGAFLDLLGDFCVYSAIPVCCGLAVASEDLKPPFPSMAPANSPWLSIAVLQASFHLNNFVLFYGAAIVEKQKRDGKPPAEKSTGIATRPALVETFESGVIFTLMIVWTRRIEALSWAMGLLVAVGTIHRAQWLISTLNQNSRALAA